MNTLTDNQQDIIKRVRSIAGDYIAPNAAKTDEESCYPEASMDALRRENFMGLLIPEKYGGMGQDLRMMVGVLEEISKKCSSTALCYLVHLGGTAAYLASDPPRHGLLQAVSNGNHLSSLALGEFGSRSHFWVPLSQAKLDNGHIILNASKSFVTSAGRVDGYVLITRSCKSKEPADTTIYYVPAGDSGLHIAGNWDALGMRGNASAPVVFKDIAIPPDYALSEPGKGMDMLLNTVLPIMNLGVASICIGIAEETIEITKQHILKSRLKHLSSTLADLPNERARLARMRLETDKARAHLAAVLDSIEHSASNATLMVMESKVAAADMILTVTDIAMKAVGGTAFNRKLGLERRFRDARAADVLGVTSDMLLEFIGCSLCGMPIP